MWQVRFLRIYPTRNFLSAFLIFTRVVIYVEILGLILQTARCGCTLIRIQAKTFFALFFFAAAVPQKRFIVAKAERKERRECYNICMEVKICRSGSAIRLLKNLVRFPIKRSMLLCTLLDVLARNITFWQCLNSKAPIYQF